MTRQENQPAFLFPYNRLEDLKYKTNSDRMELCNLLKLKKSLYDRSEDQTMPGIGCAHIALNIALHRPGTLITVLKENNSTSVRALGFKSPILEVQVR